MASVSESEIVNTLLFLRYFTAVGLASMVYDHSLTIQAEAQVIWMNPNNRVVSKVAFGINRYLTEAVIAYTVYVFSGADSHLNDQLCGRFLWLFGSAAMIFGAISHSIIVLRIYTLWDQRANVARALIATFIICIVATTAIGIVGELQLQPLFKFSEIFTTCIILSKPRIIFVVFGVQSLFDILVIFISVYNALERPHRTHSEVIMSLQHDGLKFILALFALRTSYLISSLVGDAGQCFAVVATCWSFTSIISARLHLRLDGLHLKGAQAGTDTDLPTSTRADAILVSKWESL
ncbi:hypothetical protein C8R44DRAFT_824203 [Mycena epipterygia]|nr:hypothetical protein C8R44DRAFT_824203 [Mycena epipterygia]